MEVHYVVQMQGGPPMLTDWLQFPVVDKGHVDAMTFCLVEKGMKSGEPSVLMVSGADRQMSQGIGSVIAQTSLDKFIASAVALKALAETHLKWVQREGHASIMPTLDGPARKAILEAIKKELEEWEDVLDEGQD